MQAPPKKQYHLADLITFTQAAKLLPSRPHRSSVHRWADQGVIVRGTRVRLHAVRIGGQCFTSDEWLKEFAVDAFPVERNAAPKIQRRQLNKRTDSDAFQLDEAGI